MTLDEMRKFLNIPRDTAYSLVKSLSFTPAKKRGKCWDIDKKVLHLWILEKIERKDEMYV